MTETRMRVALVVVIDVILVVVFCVIGRLSHAEGVFSDIPGLLNTIWPFLAAVLFAHLSALVVRVRTERMLPGIVVWAVTVIGGLALREATGQGAAPAFIVVATLTLALFLLGWRGVLAIMRRVRRRPVA